MASHKTSNFLQQWNRKWSSSDSTETPERHSREYGLTNQTRLQDLERAERAERAAVLQRAERLCASQEAHNRAILERLGLSIQQSTPALPPRESPDSTFCVERVRPVLKVRTLNVEKNNDLDMTDLLEDPFFEKKLRLGSQMAIIGGKLASLTATGKYADTQTPSGKLASLTATGRYADTQTPSELRAIPLLGSPSVSPSIPTPPQKVTIRKRNNPPVKANGAAKSNIKKSVERKVPPPPAPPGRMPLAPAPPKRMPLAPAPPKRMPFAPAPPATAAQPKKGGPRRGTNLRPAKVESQKVKEYPPPLANPGASLSLCFKQLESEDWEKKVEGFQSLRALSRHHPQILLTKLHEVCLVLNEEVQNLRSVVACAAMEVLAEFYIHLGKAMDPETEATGRALLLKLAQTTSVFIHQQANLALDELVKGSSPGRVIAALLNTGLSHRCAAVRGSTAQHLHQLAEIIGEECTLTAGKIFSERFMIAVTKMSLDAAPEVRHHGQRMLQGLAQQREFMVLWNKIVPVKDRRPLEKVLNKLR